MNNYENIPFMKVSKINLTQNEVSVLKLKPFPKVTVIFPKRGDAIKTNKKRILSQSSCFDANIMGLVSDIVLPKFTYYWIYGLDLFQISDRTNVPQINLKNIEPLNFPLPPLNEQIKIVEKIDGMFSILDGARSVLCQNTIVIRKYNESLIPKMMSGQFSKIFRENSDLKAISDKMLNELMSRSTEKKLKIYRKLIYQNYLQYQKIGNGCIFLFYLKR